MNFMSAIFTTIDSMATTITYSILLTSAVFERLRSILHSSDLEKRVQYMIEVMFAIRKDGFKVCFED